MVIDRQPGRVVLSGSIEVVPPGVAQSCGELRVSFQILFQFLERTELRRHVFVDSDNDDDADASYSE